MRLEVVFFSLLNNEFNASYTVKQTPVKGEVLICSVIDTNERYEIEKS